MLILKDFEIYSNKNLSNQVLRKHVKLASSQNVKNQLQYSIYNTSWFTPWGVFLIFLAKFTPFFTPNSGSFLPFVKSIKALSKKRDKTVAILRLLSYF